MEGAPKMEGRWLQMNLTVLQMFNLTSLKAVGIKEQI